MPTWSELLRSRLDLPFLGPGTDAVPFGLPPVPGESWQVDDLSEHGDEWRLRAHAGGLEAEYTLKFFADTRAVECWGEIVNRGGTTITGVRNSFALDADLDLSPDFRHAWIRSINGVRFVPTYFPPYDFAPVDRQLFGIKALGTTVILSSAKNGRTSAENLPCAILGNDARTAGIAFMLEWSGLWSITFNRGKSGYDQSALETQIGIWGLDLDLEPGESLPIPRLLIVGYTGDLDEGGNALRRHIRAHVTPKLGGEEVLPPASYNHWFTFFGDFTAEMLKPAVDASAAAGLEYFCIDDGWFAVGQPAGLGNWNRVDERKFPDGVGAFADYVRSTGMKYGTWFEPEWANRGSDLYRDHPDWFWPTPEMERPWAPQDALYVPDGTPFFQNVDYVLLDFGRPEVQDWWIERIARAYEEWGVRWIRWDFNHNPRPNWEHEVPHGQIGWRQIRHVQGLYRVWDEIMAACPELFIEQCASGGHRIELGTVRRGHSFWMNDVTEQSDLVRAFQHGLNLVLPGNYANTNICQPRHDFTGYDFLSHSAGGFGYSGALWEAPKADFERYRSAVADFKSFRHLLLGDYARPTGQPDAASDYARVEFTDGGETLSMEFNHDGPGTARFAVTSAEQSTRKDDA